LLCLFFCSILFSWPSLLNFSSIPLLSHALATFSVLCSLPTHHFSCFCLVYRSPLLFSSHTQTPPAFWPCLCTARERGKVVGWCKRLYPAVPGSNSFITPAVRLATRTLFVCRLPPPHSTKLKCLPAAQAVPDHVL
jgi:hypothetical protein